MTHDTHITPPNSKCTRLITTIVSLLIISISFITYTLIAQSPSTPPPNSEGFYLTLGGAYYLQIVRDEHGALTANGSLWGDSEFRLSSKSDHLIIESQPVKLEQLKLLFSADSINYDFANSWLGYYELVPSSTIPGDWDLVAMRDPSWLFGQSNKKIIYEMNRTGKPLEAPSPDAKSIPSYLHRVDDNRLNEHFQILETALGENRDPLLTAKPLLPVSKDMKGRILKNAGSIWADHPNDPWVQIVYLNALLAAQEWKELENRLMAWRKNIASSSNPDVCDHVAFLDRAIKVQHLTESDVNAFRFFNDDIIASPIASLDDRRTNLHRLDEFDQFMAPFNQLMNSWRVNFLEALRNVKCFRVLAEFDMLQGNYDQAWLTMKNLYHWGNLWETEPQWIYQSIGIAIRAISLKSIETYVFNAPLSGSQIVIIQNQLAKWETKSQIPLPVDMYDSFTKRYSREGIVNLEETFIRRDVADARLVNLMAGVAGWRYFQHEGRMPRIASDFLWPDGVAWPADPFKNDKSDPAHSIQWKLLNADSALQVWSIGPDKTDQQGAIEYDPTNGTTSAGDITLLVPRHKKYPFLRGGVRAKSRDDLLRQFPSGLPRDPFADQPIGYSVTNSRPVRIFSFGPDTDQNQILGADGRPKAGFLPGPAYDPTNGFVSAGDIWIKIPE